MAVTLILGFLSILLVYIWMTMKPKDFPPGPPYLPFVGCSPFLPKKFMYKTMAGEWRKKYGPVVGLLLKNKTTVAICGPREVLEVLRRDEFQGRPRDGCLKERSFGKKIGIFFSDGPFWVEQRRFVLRHLRDFGFGKKSTEELITVEVEETILHMRDLKVMKVSELFGVPTLNVIWTMVAGTRYDRSNSRLQEVLEKRNQASRSGNPAGHSASKFSILKRIVPGGSGHTQLANPFSSQHDFFRESIREHVKTLDEDNPRDLIDVYLREMKQQRSKPDTTFTEEGLITICLDLFIAGGETTKGSLGFSLLYMVLYPEIQKKVQEELDAVVGRDRRPTLEDRTRLPYVEAVLTELLRVSTIAPLTAPHRTERDAYFNGYLIPKDSTVLVCLYSLFQDKEHWGDPEAFRPERFLDANGKFVKDEWMVPFGLGKRVCLGELLARSVIFLFFTSIMQEFWVTVPEGDPKPSTVPLSAFTIAPAPFRIEVTKRT